MPNIAVPSKIIGDKYKLWRTFSWYNSLLNEVEKFTLQAISLFRQVAPARLLFQLVKSYASEKKIIDNRLQSEVALKAITFHLKQFRLIQYDQNYENYSMHPLIKTFFEHSIKETDAKNNHKILYGILTKEAAYQPDSLNEMWPLIEAVYHGCRSGLGEDALKIFRDRIDRREGYLTKNLGAWETKIELCSLFFSDKRFRGKCFLKDYEKQGHLLNAAGFAYMNIGTPAKAIPLFDKSAEVYDKVNIGDAEGQVQRNRADSFLRLGLLNAALEASKRAVKLDPSPKSQQSSLGY